MTFSAKALMASRFTTKHYDPSRRLPEHVLDELLEALRLSPTSVNAQLTRYFVASTEEEKAKLLPAIPDFNLDRARLASDVIVFTVKTEADEAHLARVLEKEVEDGRFESEDIKMMVDGARRYFANLQLERAGVAEWATRQAYLAMGVLLTVAPAMGVNATAMEGVDTAKVDEILGLKEKGLKSIAMVSLGYRDPVRDTNGERPKSRLTKEEIFFRV